MNPGSVVFFLWKLSLFVMWLILKTVFVYDTMIWKIFFVEMLWLIFPHNTEYWRRSCIIRVPFAPDNSISFSATVKKTVPVLSGFALIIIVFLSVMGDTVKTEDAVKDALLLDVFSTVYHERKNKTLKSFFGKKNNFSQVWKTDYSYGGFIGV